MAYEWMSVWQKVKLQDKLFNKDDKYAWKGYNFDVPDKLNKKDRIRQ